MLYNKSDSSFTDIVSVRAGPSECEQCDSSCRTCSGNRKDQCDSCQEGEWFQDCLQSTYVSYASAERLSLSNVESWNLYACLYVYTGMFLTSSQLCVSVCPRETHGNQASGRCEDFSRLFDCVRTPITVWSAKIPLVHSTCRTANVLLSVKGEKCSFKTQNAVQTHGLMHTHTASQNALVVVIF